MYHFPELLAKQPLTCLIVANPSKFTQKMLEYYVNEMIKEDVVFVTASGNDDREEVAVRVVPIDIRILSCMCWTMNSRDSYRTEKRLLLMLTPIRH